MAWQVSRRQELQVFGGVGPNGNELVPTAPPLVIRPCSSGDFYLGLRSHYANGIQVATSTWCLPGREKSSGNEPERSATVIASTNSEIIRTRPALTPLPARQTVSPFYNLAAFDPRTRTSFINRRMRAEMSLFLRPFGTGTERYSRTRRSSNVMFCISASKRLMGQKLSQLAGSSGEPPQSQYARRNHAARTMRQLQFGLKYIF
jgi:hypothetical protein